MTFAEPKSDKKIQSSKTIDLPEPVLMSDISVEEAIADRRSVRSYSSKSLTLQHLSQMLWSAQGITNNEGLRAAPSAGALYPLELYVVAGNVENLEPGVYRYIPEGHKLTSTLTEDKRKELVSAASNQDWIADAPVIIVFSAVYERTTSKYGERGIRYVHMDTGFAGENLFLQAEALGLSSIVVGSFKDEAVKKVLSLDNNENPLILMPVGYAK